MPSKKILVIGDVFVDVDITFQDRLQNVHLGGVFHSARSLSSLGVEYGLMYVSPNYLDKSIEKFSELLNSSFVKKLASVNGSPNVMLIGDKYEAGDQFYSEILRNQYELKLEADIKQTISEFNPTDVLLYPISQLSELIVEVCNELNINIHIDVQYEDDIKNISSTYKLKSLIMSSSSTYFLSECNGDFDLLVKSFENDAIDILIFKENRGGSRLVNLASKFIYEIPCFPIEISHSVGVGDCFNSVFITYYDSNSFNYVGKLASYIASLYASTYIFDEFNKLVSTTLAFEKEYFESLVGQRLAWEDRKEHLIYIAAPDFPNVDTRLIDSIEQNLTYHGFSIFRPIKENGLVNDSIERSDELNIFSEDVKALEHSSLMIAVLLYDDPGTLVEIGYFFKSNKPIVLFDPYGIARNMFLRNSVNDICYNLESLTEAVFKHLSRGNI